MHSNPRFVFHIRLWIALTMSLYLCACGMDFEPDVIYGEENPGSANDYSSIVYIFDDGSVRPINSMPELDGIPPLYRRFLEANPEVLNNLVWADDKYPEGHLFISEADKVSDLAARLAGDKRLTTPPVPCKYEDDNRAYYTEEDAWNIYLAHITHALEVEINQLVPWSLSDYTEENLALIFDSRYLLYYDPLEGLYRFSFRFPGGRQGITDWSSSVGYEFLEQHNMIGTQAETVFHFTNWIRENLVHCNTSTPENWDEYPGYPPVEAILNPPEGHRHWTLGCAGTSSLYIVVIQSVNIPVARGVSYLAVQGGPEQAHNRVEFPSLGIGLAHADDAHNELSRRGVNEIPVVDLFYTFEELAELVDEPILQDGAPSRGEQAFYNMFKRVVETAYRHMADSILKRRARDLLGSGDNTMEDLLMARVCSPSPCLWEPPFDAGERQTMMEGIDSTLFSIGSGDILEGSRMVLRR